MKIILYLTFLISGLNCWSISKGHATDENKQFKDNQLEGPPPCEKYVIDYVNEICRMEYRYTNYIEECVLHLHKRFC